MLRFAVFCIENVAKKLSVDAERIHQAFTPKSDILHGYIVPEYEVLHTQSREYIVDDLLAVMKERGGSVILYHGSFVLIWKKASVARSRRNKASSKRGNTLFGSVQIRWLRCKLFPSDKFLKSGYTFQGESSIIGPITIDVCRGMRK